MGGDALHRSGPSHARPGRGCAGRRRVRHQSPRARADAGGHLRRARGCRRRMPCVELHAHAFADLRVGRRRVRGRDARRPRLRARTAYRRHHHRRQRSGDDGVRIAVVGPHRLFHAADRTIAAASGTILKLDRTLVAIVAAGVALAVVPFLRLPAFYESFLYLVLHWIVLATSWNILSGYSGYFSFGHGAFYGTGVYTTAVLAGKYDVPFLWTLPAAALLAALLGVALGAVVFRVRRIRGEAFALLTLAVTFVLATIVLK